MSNEPWHLSKSVPITFILAIVVQTFTIGWYLSDMGGAINQNAKDLARHEASIVAMQNNQQQQAIMLARIEENLKAIRESVEAIAVKARSNGAK
jgi:hypothetical protein